ncbi:MAG: aspartate-semialdehyde dehydrogenase [Phycisphaerales bacterium]
MPTTPRHPTLAIVGATGAVGREFLAVLEERRFPHGPVRLLASPRSAGTVMTYRGEPHTVQALSPEAFEGIDLALFSAGGAISKQYCPVAAAAGAVVIDNSSAFRMVEGVPLVVPEVNPGALEGIRRSEHRPPKTAVGGTGGTIIANPNCSTIIMLLAVTPLRRAFGVERVIVSTYQAVSGAGAGGMRALIEETRAELEAMSRCSPAGQASRLPAAGTAAPQFFPEPCAFNVFSHNTAVDPETGRNVEEEKMIVETRKIWGDPGARISATCIRVPTLRAHAESINVELSRPAAEEEVRGVLSRAPGVEVVDDRAGNRFPTPRKASGRDAALVGRIRRDATAEETVEGGRRLSRGYDIFVCADQLRKGAALNAVQIAELVFGIR